MANVRALLAEVDCSLEQLILALFTLLRSHPNEAQLTIINPGCSDSELDEAEQRIMLTLPPLHRLLLKQSNGGTLPYIGSIQHFAAAIPREIQWRWINGPTPSSLSDAFDKGPGDGPFTPLMMGDSLTECGYTARQAEQLGFSNFVVIAAGYDGEFFGYSRSQMGRVDCVYPDPGRSWFRFSRVPAQSKCEHSSILKRVRVSIEVPNRTPVGRLLSTDIKAQVKPCACPVRRLLVDFQLNVAKSSCRVCRERKTPNIVARSPDPRNALARGQSRETPPRTHGSDTNPTLVLVVS